MGSNGVNKTTVHIFLELEHQLHFDVDKTVIMFCTSNIILSNLMDICIRTYGHMDFEH